MRNGINENLFNCIRKKMMKGMDTQREDFFDDRLFLLKYTFKFNTILNSCFG